MLMKMIVKQKICVLCQNTELRALLLDGGWVRCIPNGNVAVQATDSG